MEYDIKYYAPYIAQKIKDNKLDNLYVVPFNDAENDKHEIMDNLLKGGVIL